MTTHQIPLLEPCLGGNEQRYLTECIESGFVSSVGPFVDRFENEFATFVGAENAVACSTGTAALHVALKVAGVGAGDDVLVSDFTFIATVNPIVYLGARPVLVDADLETWNMDPQLVIDELERRTKAGIAMPKAVLVAHVLGLPANLEPIAEACERYGVTLIEDAAEALGASYVEGGFAGRQAGTIGRLGCFSFNGNKVMTTGGGGMIVSTDEELARRARHLTTQARLPGLEYIHDEVAYNYRLTNIQAAVGVAQLEQLPSFLEKKHRIARIYDAQFVDIEGVEFQPRPSWSRPSWWLYSVAVDHGTTRHEGRGMIESLIEEGIGARPLWAPVHTMRMYSEARRLANGVGMRLFREGVSLPSSVGLDGTTQRRITQRFADCLVTPHSRGTTP